MIAIALSIWQAVFSGAAGGAPADPYSLDFSADGNLMFG